ncbi:ABC transporter permease [Desulfitobacterium chlororespirans]|uniref:ABC-2 family transporter protein n=1 Tax=Desulfitobacterium chlororespirans DSM 11544 TaxID=1121395 RepID=A0A1M7TXF4_9FIRM|nr:ABC transporter permease subunit [Desulfitobacterium chlororespirans]SHN75390.1 ABC-2 family transporter protein [Desulfitobacterium chlororespirans DSM 11544]
MLSIIKLTFREILSRRIFFITLLMTLAFLIFFGVTNHYAAQGFIQAMHGFDSTNTVIQNSIRSQIIMMGLNFSSMILALLTILSTVGGVAGEIENHQIDTILARPLPRRSYVLGKFLGLGTVVVVYALSLFVGVLLINQLTGGDIAARLEPSSVIQGGLIFVLSPLLIVAAGLWLSTRMSTINSGIILIILYGVGFVGGLVEQIGTLLNNPSLINTGIASSLIFPYNALFRKTDALLTDSGNGAMAMLNGGAGSELSNLMLGYGVFYALALLFWAIRHFEQRDV